MPQIYCAGPLFNSAEQQEMADIAALFEANGYTTFLPQRDGFEFSRLVSVMRAQGVAAADADRALQRAIFALDVFQLLSHADVVVANLNGRVPDEGTVVEAALAWHAGKPLVLYKADARSKLDGTDNPMLLGLSDFRVVPAMNELPAAVAQALSEPADARVARILQAGERIAAARQQHGTAQELAAMLLSL